MMWWLTFLNGGVVIIEASSLIHARSLAAAHGLGRVVHFAEGHFINPESAALIPDRSERLPSPTAPSRLGLYKPRLRIVSPS
jgi:hypothetical protein